MNILYITTSYDQNNSSAAIRNNGLVKGFISLGHQVTVLTVDWPESIKSEYLSTINIGADIIRIKLSVLNHIPVSNKQKRHKKLFIEDIVEKLRHFVRDGIFFPDVCKSWVKYIPNLDFSKYSVIISSSDFKSSHYVGLKIKQQNSQIKWLQIWGDPWHDDVNLSWLHKIRAKKKERILLEKADYVVYVSDLTRNKISATYPHLKSKLFFIPRSYYKEAPKYSEPKDFWEILYPGVLSSGRNIIPLLSAIELYNNQTEKKIKLTLYGNYSGLQRNELNKFSFTEINNSVEFKRISELYQQADIALLISNNSDSTQIPGKLYDYMGTNLPVLSIVNNYSDKICHLLKEFDRCIISENKVPDILSKLKTITSNYRKYNFDNFYSPTSIASEYINILKNN